MGVYTGTVPTFLAGELPDADKFTEITNFMTAWTSSLTAYTPTMSSSGGGASVGNGTLTAGYSRIGKTVVVRIVLTWGSTTTYGSGFVRFSLPVTSVALDQVGPGTVVDSGTATILGASHIDAGSPTLLIPISTGGVVTGTSPMTWTTNDQLRSFMMYEAA